MAQTSIRLDRSEWDKAVTGYAASTRKTLAEAQNKQTVNLAFQGLQFVKVAERSAIETLEGIEWWPRFVAKHMVKRYGKMAASGAWQAEWSVREGRKLSENHTRWRELAVAMSRDIIRRRLVAVTYLRFFFVSLANAASRYVKNSKTAPYRKGFRDFHVEVNPATPSDLSVSWRVWYDYKMRNKRTAQKAEALLDTALQKTIPATIRDMEAETHKRLEQDARRFSAL
jgi:hypothetical protein